MKLLSILSLQLISLVVSSPISISTTTSTSHSHSKSTSNPTAFTAAPFLTGVFKDYYSGFEPTQTSVEPQPKVSDDVKHGKVFSLNLTDPDTIPIINLKDPVILPPSRDHPNPKAEVASALSNFSTPASIASANLAYNKLVSLIQSNVTKSSQCTTCISGLQILQNLSFEWPWEVPGVTFKLCQIYSPDSYCGSTYSYNAGGGVVAQVLQFSNLTGLDGLMICAHQVPNGPYCSVPPITKYDPSKYFNTTVPASRVAPTPSGNTTKVLHLSDFHLDPRYTVGSESKCGQYLCCRNGLNTTSAAPGLVLSPAPRFGAFKCDTPYDLAIAAMEAIPVLTGTSKTGFDFTIFTGDLVSHDEDPSMGRDYVEYEEDVIYGLFKKFLGKGPVYAALGNHDSWPQALNSLNSLNPKYIADEFGWNYDHLAALWEHEGWIKSGSEAEQVRTHYGAFSILHKKGFRIISFNSDFIYTANLFNYINSEDPDPSGTFAFVASELQRAEDNGERVWVIGHVLSGWDGSASLPNPTDLWSQIIDRYSPHVIAALFVGHVHDEFMYLNYANNATIKNSETAKVVTWAGPSITPLTNLNPGFRLYEVDTVSFDVMESYTYYSNVSTYGALDSQIAHGPSFHYEYSARDAYGKNITSDSGKPWDKNYPLNATWFHKVTEQMEIQPSLVNDFNSFQGRLSVKTPNCTSEACVKAKICYMRAGNHALGSACPKGFSSVQSAFSGH